MKRTVAAVALVALGLVVGCGEREAYQEGFKDGFAQGASPNLEMSPAAAAKVSEMQAEADIQTARTMLSGIATEIKLFRLDQKRLPLNLVELKSRWKADPWGHALVYEPGKDGRSFTLYSIGPDGTDGTGDDVRLVEE